MIWPCLGANRPKLAAFERRVLTSPSQNHKQRRYGKLTQGPCFVASSVCVCMQ
ncbi:hypothetical protein AIOL_001296 [Candidatus Rhodobacter oscarellae]|uniref:Uncharacterized protein n=1 Tax=Candidatus Rhodobacter oscarellae TaxID=1675527 RepID=A0A0J9E3E3_9RHOB|nr:hypothetical protein AIOL_001296 [Candidatus Rhodobacter lobularis]